MSNRHYKTVVLKGQSASGVRFSSLGDVATWCVAEVRHGHCQGT